jgi:predicted DNA-binding protein with PD1-like motif
MEPIRIQSLASEAGRRIVGRLLPGTDLINGIEAMCQQHQVAGATIVSAIGSLTQAQLVYAVPDETGKIGIRYHDPVTVGGPLEILACQGMIGRSGSGELSVHLHGLVSDPTMRVIGGHFLAGGNPVLATAEILIQECSDVRMIREQDKETGFPLFKFF